jgi:hypothetical protein
MAEFTPRNLRSFICSHVSEKTRPILLVVHEDGDWQFVCGAADHAGDDGHLIGVGHLIDRDPSLNECADLPIGFVAERSAVGEPWLRSEISSEPVNAGVEGAAKRLSALAVPVRSGAFKELIEAATSYLKDCQRHLEQEYRLSKWPRYDWSQETRKLVFSDGGVPKVVADIQFVGSVSTETDTWLWAWDNHSVDPGLFESLLRIRQYGEAHGFPHLTTPKWYAHEVDGWEMTSIAAFLLRAKGAYRSPGKNGFMFMIITSVAWAT